jgi:4-hydroxy-3-methylbut-2-enyl diphosphate reductase
VISAFGTDFRDVQKLKDKGVTVVDSTCGAIVNVWTRVSNYAKAGAITVMHGKRNHEETRATVSQAVKSGGHYITIENKKEAADLVQMIAGKMTWGDFSKKYPDAGSPGISFDVETCKMGMANQTTMLKGESLEIQEMLRGAFRARFGDAATAERFKSFDTICGATQDRQDAMRHLLDKKLDLILVVGGFNSSNTTHLAELAVNRIKFFHIEGEGDIHSKDEIRARDPITGEVKNIKGWFGKNTKQIGITSGASTPDVTLLQIIEKIRGLTGPGPK